MTGQEIDRLVDKVVARLRPAIRSVLCECLGNEQARRESSGRTGTPDLTASSGELFLFEQMASEDAAELLGASRMPSPTKKRSRQNS